MSENQNMGRNKTEKEKEQVKLEEKWKLLLKCRSHEKW